MNEIVPVSKDENHQNTVPSIWRKTFCEVMEAFVEGNFELARGVAGVQPVSSDDARRMARSIEEYGEELTSLPDETWKTSMCQWMKKYWDVLIDLYTVEEGASDLVLAVRVYEKKSGFIFEVISIHVP